jgi:hypothetical protein
MYVIGVETGDVFHTMRKYEQQSGRLVSMQPADAGGKFRLYFAIE